MGFWDLLFLLFVLAPLAAGGVWLHRPHLHLELTQAGPAALLLLLILLFLSRRGAEPWRDSRACRALHSFWQRWRSALDGRAPRALALLVGGNAVLWFLTSLSRHRAFCSGLADLGIFTNAIWNQAFTGTPYSSVKDGLSLLADHQIFLLYPLGWLFRLWPSPVFLLLLQSLGLSAGAAALYLLGRQRLGRAHALVPWLPFLYLLAGPLRAANLFDFHPEVFMLPAFLFAAYFLQEAGAARRALGGVFLLLALAAKESAGPVACGLGLAWLLGAGPAPTRTFTRALGAGVIALGLGVFVLDSRFVPGWFGGKYAYSQLYAPLGSSVAELALSPFRMPGVFFGRLFLSLARWKFLLGLLLPLGFLPLLAPRAAVAALPGLLMLFLTEGDHRISLGFHYAIEPMVGLLFALPLALERAPRLAGHRWAVPALAACALLSYGRSDPYYWRLYSADAHQRWVRDTLLPRVHPDRRVSSSYALMPHLATRHWSHQLPIWVDEHHAPVDCAVLERSVNNTPMSDEQAGWLLSTLELNKFTPELRCRSLTVLRRPGGEPCLTETVACPETL